MRVRNLFIVLMLLVGLLPVAAQKNEAKVLLDRIVENFEHSNGVSIIYSIRPEGAYSYGRIQLKGEKFLLKSPGMTTWFDGHTQWTYLEANDEVNISEPTPEELQTLNPFAWLRLYRQGYALQLESSGKRASVIVMTTTEPNQEWQRIQLYVEHVELRPMEIRMRTKDSAEDIVIKITSYDAEGENYPDAMFTFNKKDYPTVEVVDLR